jgi:hypothetical protein
MQQVRCYVLESTETDNEKKRKTISLSMRSAYINKGIAFKNLLPGYPIYGCITSKEDHGYVISAGMNGVTFFLPHDSIPQNTAEYIIGQPIEAVIDAKVETEVKAKVVLEDKEIKHYGKDGITVEKTDIVKSQKIILFGKIMMKFGMELKYTDPNYFQDFREKESIYFSITFHL